MHERKEQMLYIVLNNVCYEASLESHWRESYKRSHWGWHCWEDNKIALDLHTRCAACFEERKLTEAAETNRSWFDQRRCKRQWTWLKGNVEEIWGEGLGQERPWVRGDCYLHIVPLLQYCLNTGHLTNHVFKFPPVPWMRNPSTN